jgi:hypothetical protein
MNLIKNKLVLSTVAALLLSTTAFADNTSEINELKKQVKMLMQKSQEQDEQTQALIDETSDFKTGFNYTKVDTNKAFSGMGAAASKVYYSKSPLSIGGYGEMYFSNYSEEQGSGATAYKNKVSVYRFVPYIGYKFSDNIILNTEIEFEKGGVEAGNDDSGEVKVEFMYLDFLINKNLNVRLGNFLIPMGLINFRHEPTLFNTVQRPNTSKYLIPSTWSESGAMVFGEITEGLEYKFAGTTGFDSSKTDAKWLRSARGNSFNNTDPSFGVTARVDYTGINGLLIGASVYADNDINMFDIHTDYKIGGFRAYGVYTESTRDEKAAQDAEYIDGNGDLITQATDAKGGFLNLSYDLLALTSSEYSLPLFIQYESISPRDKLSGAGSYDSIDSTTIGMNFFPHEQVVLKVDFVMQDTYDSTPDTDIISASIGFVF